MFAEGSERWMRAGWARRSHLRPVSSKTAKIWYSGARDCYVHLWVWGIETIHGNSSTQRNQRSMNKEVDNSQTEVK